MNINHNPNSNVIILELDEEECAAVSQAWQISKISPKGLTRLGLLALCRHIERHVRMTYPIEIISTRELEGYKQTTTVPWRANAPCSTGTAGSRTTTPGISLCPVVLPG